MIASANLVWNDWCRLIQGGGGSNVARNVAHVKLMTLSPNVIPEWRAATEAAIVNVTSSSTGPL
uniref:Uncharacterized protein n=1 Tax=Peronospora matthiolae TaxID=2874970 RepID=A0AAV1TVG2_9STRA